MTTFGRQLQSAIERRGISQTSLGKAVGVSGGYISRLCSDQRNPRHDTAVALANELGLTGAPRVLFLSHANHIERPLDRRTALVIDILTREDHEL